jgi:calcineurin-like phosphoesterase family protein
MRQVTVLHLSDLHFRHAQAYDADALLQALLLDIDQCIVDDGFQPDFAVVTGDIAFSGSLSEYKVAQRFFNDLLRIVNLSKDRLFVIPGNHDVDRSLVTALVKNASDLLTDRESINAILTSSFDRELMFAGMRGYAEFVNGYFDGHLLFDDEHYFYVSALALAGQQIALLGLNSAWLCYGGEERGRVLLGERQVRDSLRAAQEADIRIALLHHPFAWLMEFDRRHVESRLRHECHFIMHGHVHEPRVQVEAAPDGETVVIPLGRFTRAEDIPIATTLFGLTWTKAREVCTCDATATGCEGGSGRFNLLVKSEVTSTNSAFPRSWHLVRELCCRLSKCHRPSLLILSG